jgi:hypothetical protein
MNDSAVSPEWPSPAMCRLHADEDRESPGPAAVL